MILFLIGHHSGLIFGSCLYGFLHNFFYDFLHNFWCNLLVHFLACFSCILHFFFQFSFFLIVGHHSWPHYWAHVCMFFCTMFGAIFWCLFWHGFLYFASFAFFFPYSRSSFLASFSAHVFAQFLVQLSGASFGMVFASFFPAHL